MIMDLVDWQRIDSTTTLIEPWFTWPFMDWVKQLDLKEKNVIEFGAGYSTAWWRKKTKWVDSIEAKEEWAIIAAKECAKNSLLNGWIYAKELREGVPEDLEEYMQLIPEKGKYDIIIIDGIYRTEIVEWGINHLRAANGGYLFIDNLDQDYVWISPKAMELLAPYEGETFVQPGHTNHEGKPWNSRYYIINK